MCHNPSAVLHPPHPAALFFCACFSWSENIFSFQETKCLIGSETAVIGLNTLFILSFTRAPFLCLSKIERHLWNTFKCACEMHSAAGLQGARQSAGSCLQAGDASWDLGQVPCSLCTAWGAALPSRLHQNTRAGAWQVETVLCLLLSAVVMFGWVFYSFMLNTTITSCVYTANFMGENKGIFVLSCRQHSTHGTGSVFIS